MVIKILGTESLGVRGLACSVELENRKIVIDPGIALGWSRHGFLPHPFQIAIGAGIREKIVEELKNATDVVFSHFDGDHCPLSDANPYQLGLDEVREYLSQCRIWARGSNNSSPIQQRTRKELSQAIMRDLHNADGMKDGALEFCFPVPHGQPGDPENMVMMSRITEKGITFVHASDIQLLAEKTIDQILAWKPDIVLASGPPLYHYTSASFQARIEKAWGNALRLSQHVDTLIIDHHLLRSEGGIDWLEKLSKSARHHVICAADFMKRAPIFLEAWRSELYEWMPVPKDWHENYQQKKADVNDYRTKGWEALMTHGKIKPCKWYFSCPIKELTEVGKLARYWIENYCLISNQACVRYQMEEKGQYHPDNMLPNGEIREDLYFYLFR